VGEREREIKRERQRVNGWKRFYRQKEMIRVWGESETLEL
jgi:hypothetical protein